MSAGPTIRYTLQLVLTGRESAEELKNTITTLQNRIQTTGQTLGTALGGGAQRANISLRQTADGVKETVTVSGQLNDSMKQVNNTLGQTGNSLTNVANNFIKLGSIAHQVMSIYTQYTVWTIRMLQYQNQYRSAILREQRLMRDLITVDKEHGVVLQQNIKYYKDLYQTQMQAAPNFDKVRQATNGLSEAINLYGESSDAAREAFVEYKDAIAQWGESVMKVAQPQDRAGLQTSISQIIDQLNTAVNTGNFSGWQDLGAQNWDKQWGAKYGSLGTYGMSVNSLMDTDTQNLKNMINQTIPIQYEINKTTLDWAAQMEASAYDIYTSGQKLSQANQEMSILGVAIALQGLSIFMQVGQLFGGVLGKLVFGTVGSAGGSLLGGGGSMLGGSLLGNAAGAAGNAMGTAPLIAGGAAAGMTAAQWGGLSLGTKLAYSPLGGLAMKATAPLYTSGLLGSTAASGGTMSALMGAMTNPATIIAVAGIVAAYGMYKLGTAADDRRKQAEKTTASYAFTGLSGYNIAQQLLGSENGMSKLSNTFTDFALMAKKSDAELRASFKSIAEGMGQALSTEQAQKYVDNFRNVFAQMSSPEFAKSTGMTIPTGGNVPGYAFGTPAQWQGITGVQAEYNAKQKKLADLKSDTVTTTTEAKFGVSKDTPGAKWMPGFGMQPGGWMVPGTKTTRPKTMEEKATDILAYNKQQVEDEYNRRLFGSAEGKPPSEEIDVLMRNPASMGMMAPTGQKKHNPAYDEYLKDVERLKAWRDEQMGIVEGGGTPVLTDTGAAGGQSFGYYTPESTDQLTAQIEAILANSGDYKTKGQQIAALVNQQSFQNFPSSMSGIPSDASNLFGVAGFGGSSYGGSPGTPYVVQFAPEDPLTTAINNLSTNIANMGGTETPKGEKALGGLIAETGRYTMHAGEWVTPEAETSMGNIELPPGLQSDLANVRELPQSSPSPTGAGSQSTSNSYSFGDIHVSVEQMNSDQDIRTTAYKLRRYIQQETSRSTG